MFSRSLFLVLSSQPLHECNFTMVAYAITERRIIKDELCHLCCYSNNLVIMYWYTLISN